MSPANVEARALQAGAAVGPYEIVSFLAAGGMGEVYIARDERLGREVAIKVLPAVYGSDPERLKRFEQEARATGSLNHPNVIAVYDVGKAGELPYIVTELLEGKTLRAALQERALTVRQAIDYAIQIARGLAAAHDKGIIHRDLKPANIFITPGGHVKIVDFGLAKLAHPEWERTPKDEDTVSMASRPGAVVGSAGYMSPEQVAGTAADHRSDIFSFGAILYEMVSGRRAFQGDSAVEGMHAILKEEPLEITTSLPLGLRLTIQRCLKKSPAERFQSARDLVFSLEELPAAPPSFGDRPGWLALPRRGFATAMAVVLTLAMIGGFAARSGASRPKSSIPVEPNSWPFREHEIVPLPELGSDIFSAALSPDGNFLAYVERKKLKASLLVRQLVSGRELTLFSPSEENFSLQTLDFSRDGNYVYYSSQKMEHWEQPAKVFKVSIFGGEAVKFPDEIRPAGVTFSPDEKLVSFQRRNEKDQNCQMVSNIDGSGLRSLTCLPGRESLNGAMWAPHGRSIVAILRNSASPWSLLEVDVSTGASRGFCKLGKRFVSSLEWLPDGTGLILGTAPPSAQLLYVSYPGGEIHPIFSSLSESSLFSATADSRTLFASRANVETTLRKISLQADRTTEQSRSESLNGWNGLVWLSTGEILLAADDPAGGSRLWISDSDGRNRREFLERHIGSVKGVAASNRFVVFVRGDDGTDWGMGDLWRADLDGKNLQQLTSGFPAGRPSFTPDGQWVVYTVSAKPDEPRAWRVPVSGGEPQIIDPDRYCLTAGVSPNGKWLACFSGPLQSEGKSVIPIEGGPPVWQRDFPSIRRFLRWMPDSSGIAYALWDYGDTTIRVQPLNDGPSRLLTTFNFESERVNNFAFSPDGKELFVAASRQTNQPFLIRDKTARKQ